MHVDRGQKLRSEGKLDEASSTLSEALRIQEKVLGPSHPRVAGTLNELGKIAQRRGHLDEAERDLMRAVEIYKSAYNGKHYYIGVAESNLAGVLVDEKHYQEAERLFGEALQMYKQTLAPEHQLFGIAHVRLGRALLRDHKYVQAETESQLGYELLSRQATPPPSWMQNARTDLAEIYDALHRPDKAARFRSELAANETKPVESARRN